MAVKLKLPPAEPPPAMLESRYVIFYFCYFPLPSKWKNVHKYSGVVAS
jgi:hypothetical protein